MFQAALRTSFRRLLLSSVVLLVVAGCGNGSPAATDSPSTPQSPSQASTATSPQQGKPSCEELVERDVQFVREALEAASQYPQAEFEQRPQANNPPEDVAQVLAEAQAAAQTPPPESCSQRMLVQRNNEEIEAIEPAADTGAVTMHRLLLGHGREQLVRLVLRDAAVAQESYWTEHDEYATGVDPLAQEEGLDLGGVDVQVAAANTESFCMQAAAPTGRTSSLSEGTLEAALGECE